MSEAKPTQIASPGKAASGSSRLEDQVRSLRLPRNELRESGRSWFPWLVAIVALSASGWFYLQLRQAQQALAEASIASQRAANASSTTGSGGGPQVAATAAVGAVALESRGYVVPAHQILVSPQVSGRIVKLNIEEGRRVVKGELLAQIDRTEYAADHARAVAQLALSRQRLLELERGNRPEEIEQSRAELQEYVAQLTQLEIEYGRNAQLVKGNLIPQEEFEVTESKYRAMQRRVEKMRFALKLMEDGPRQERIESARAEVQQSEAELAKAVWRLDNCQILSPIAGTILKKNAEEGNIVNPVAFNGSYSICELADLSDLEVALDIQERDIAQVFSGQKCLVRPAEAYPNRVYEGYVARLMPIADRAKGAIQVRVRVAIPAAEEGVYLKPEMSAKVTFKSPESAGNAPATPTGDTPPAELDNAAVDLPSATSGSTSRPVDKPAAERENGAGTGEAAANDAAGKSTGPLSKEP